MTDKIVVLTTCSSGEEAARIGRHLVESRLAACVQLVPGVKSVYQWQGAVEEADESLLMIKSSRALFDKLRQEIVKLHSYSEPEIVAMAIVDGSPTYLDWMDRELLKLR